MQQIIRFSSFVNEVLMHPEFNKFKNDEDYYIIAFQKYIYLIEDEDVEQLKKVFYSIIDKSGMDNDINMSVNLKHLDEEDFSEIKTFIKENLPNAIILGYRGGSDSIMLDITNPFQQDYQSSKYFIDTLKTVKKELKVEWLEVYEMEFDFEGHEIELEDRFFIDNLIDTFDKELKYKKMPKMVYHGTALEHLQRINKVGLRPSKDNTNFGKMDISHDDRIFLTSTKNDAFFYAFNAANNTNTPPIILEIDSSGIDTHKVDFDFDFYKMFVGYDDDHKYSKIGKQPSYESNPKVFSHLKNKYVGATFRKFAYKGAIMPKYLEALYYNTNNHIENEFRNRLPKEEFDDMIDMYDYFDDIGIATDDQSYSLDFDYYEELKREAEEIEEEEMSENKIYTFNRYVKNKKIF